MVALEVTSTTTDIWMTAMIKKEKVTKRKEQQRQIMQQVMEKNPVNKPRELSLKFPQHLVNKLVHRIMMMERKRKHKHPVKRSDLRHQLIKFDDDQLKFE